MDLVHQIKNKKMKFKFFENYPSSLEKEINRWLTENPNIVIVSQQTTDRNDYLVVTIFYNEIEIS